jgi:uncharacterized protein DUF6458
LLGKGIHLATVNRIFRKHRQEESVMGIGVGIFLIAVGAVLAFAVNATVSGVSITTIGVILMIVGALGLVIDIAIFAPRRRSVVVQDDAAAPYSATRTVVR